MTTLYAVFKQGAYRHECLGIFDDDLEAKVVAEHAATTGSDHYHRFEVVPFELNKRTPLDGPANAYYGPNYDEPEPIHTAK